MGVNAYHYRQQALKDAGKDDEAAKLTLPKLDYSKVAVYKETDLKADVHRFEELHRHVRNFHWMFHADRMSRLAILREMQEVYLPGQPLRLPRGGKTGRS